MQFNDPNEVSRWLMDNHPRAKRVAAAERHIRHNILTNLTNEELDDIEWVKIFNACEKQMKVKKK